MGKTLHFLILLITVGAFLRGLCTYAFAQDANRNATEQKEGSVRQSPLPLSPITQKLDTAKADTGKDLARVDTTMAHLSTDTLAILKPAADSAKPLKKISLTKRIPDPKRALWLSLVVPGAGQIYNRKYWKLPIIYGGFIGCTYALLWNQQMYKDYSQAYIDIMDDDPNTASYKNMLPMGYDITGREDQFKDVFRHKKDFYRRNRDLSIFAFIGVYIISVIDAYVDAQLSTFDITPDLSLKIEPTIINQGKSVAQTKSNAVGVQCSLNF